MPAFPASQHTLPNGFTLYLSPNPAEPRIYTEIAVRAGSKHDPDRSTGLAHYLEHMLFKGTAQLGTKNWEAEAPLLQQIAQTYEEHRNTQDPQQRRQLYQQIDSLSQRAAAYALPGEYDRIMAQMGARGTNAYTWVDQTIFLNDIPAGELRRWMHLESERFSTLVLRLFHTELETVFEEFNISQDKDVRKVMRESNAALFSPHPYGTHTTIGLGEHLKAPSHFDIYDFFATHYVPGNMAIILAGDFDPAEALELARQTFGTWEAKPVPTYTPVQLPYIPPPPHSSAAGPPTAPQAFSAAGSSFAPQALRAAGSSPPEAISVFGQEAEAAYLHWRIPGATTREALVAQVAVGMLSNRQAGLFDQELVSAQKVLSASAGITPMAEFASIRASVKPRPGQTLEQAAALVLTQVQRLAEGKYPSWLREAVVVDHELTITRTSESNQGRAGVLTTAFIHRLPLDEVLDRVNNLRSITEEEIQAFAKTYLTPAQCVTVLKRQGEDPNVMKVEKPEITPVPLNTQEVSGFAERLLSMQPTQTEARFADLDAEVTQLPIANGVDLHHLANEENGLFELLYVFDFGRQSDKWINFSTKYLRLLGTKQRSNADVQVAFYRLGLEWQIQAAAHRTYVGVSGLDAHLPQGLALLEELLRECQPDELRWTRFVDDVAQNRRNLRADKQVVLRKAMNQYARYGEHSPLVDALSLTELREASATAVTQQIHELATMRRAVFYYGPRTPEAVVEQLRVEAALPEVPTIVPSTPVLPVVKPSADRVLFVDFPMVQVEVLALRHIHPGFSPEVWVLAHWFNQYYGLGLSSVVFSELRESRALAYSTYAYAESPARLEDDHFLQAFIGTQPDKLFTALEAMRDLLSNWRFDAAAAERVRAGMLQQMRTERDLRQSRYWLWRQGADRGIDGNQREWLFTRLQEVTTHNLQEFFGLLGASATTYLVLGERSRIDFNELTEFGHIEELSLDAVFGHNLA